MDGRRGYPAHAGYPRSVFPPSGRPRRARCLQARLGCGRRAAGSARRTRRPSGRAGPHPRSADRSGRRSLPSRPGPSPCGSRHSCVNGTSRAGPIEERWIAVPTRPRWSMGIGHQCACLSSAIARRAGPATCWRPAAASGGDRDGLPVGRRRLGQYICVPCEFEFSVTGGEPGNCAERVNREPVAEARPVRIVASPEDHRGN